MADADFSPDNCENTIAISSDEASSDSDTSSNCEVEFSVPDRKHSSNAFPIFMISGQACQLESAVTCENIIDTQGNEPMKTFVY